MTIQLNALQTEFFLKELNENSRALTSLVAIINDKMNPHNNTARDIALPAYNTNDEKWLCLSERLMKLISSCQRTERAYQGHEGVNLINDFYSLAHFQSIINEVFEHLGCDRVIHLRGIVPNEIIYGEVEKFAELSGLRIVWVE